MVRTGYYNKLLPHRNGLTNDAVVGMVDFLILADSGNRKLEDKLKGNLSLSFCPKLNRELMLSYRRSLVDFAR